MHEPFNTLDDDSDNTRRHVADFLLTVDCWMLGVCMLRGMMQGFCPQVTAQCRLLCAVLCAANKPDLANSKVDNSL